MARSKPGQPDKDKSLGMDRRICRRDFLNSALLASGSALLAPIAPRELLAQDAQAGWTGYGGAGDYKDSNGNTAAVMNAGHQIRDGVFDSPPADAADTGETFDCVVVGGGISGLAGALAFATRTGRKLTCLVIEDHPIFGGEAKRNEFLVDGQKLMAPQGSDHFQIPYPYSFIADFYRQVGIDWREFEYQTWGSSQPPVPLGRTFEAMPSPVANYYGAKFGKTPGIWLIDPKLAEIPIPDEMRKELIKYHSQRRHAKKPFDYPGDAASRRLDSMTLEEHLMEQGLSRKTIRTLMVPGEAGGFGAGPDAVSAYCAYAFDELHALDDTPETGWRAFPGGNAGIARHITKTLIPDSIAGSRTLHDICCNPVDFSALDPVGRDQPVGFGSVPPPCAWSTKVRRQNQSSSASLTPKAEKFIACGRAPR